MPPSIVGKRKQKIVEHVSPVEVARLSRYDYAVRTARATHPDILAAHTAATASQATSTAKRLRIDPALDMALEIAKPLQVSVVMGASYAAELLRKLRDAKKPRRGDHHQISVDCPVEIVMDGATLKALIDKLEGEVGGEGMKATHRRVKKS